VGRRADHAGASRGGVRRLRPRGCRLMLCRGADARTPHTVPLPGQDAGRLHGVGHGGAAAAQALPDGRRASAPGGWMAHPQLCLTLGCQRRRWLAGARLAGATRVLRQRARARRRRVVAQDCARAAARHAVPEPVRDRHERDGLYGPQQGAFRRGACRPGDRSLSACP